MRMVSSWQLSRIWDYEPTRMLTVCLCSEIEDCDATRMASPYRFSRTKAYETMCVVPTSIWVALGPIHTKNLALPSTGDWPRLGPSSKWLLDQSHYDPFRNPNRGWVGLWGSGVLGNDAVRLQGQLWQSAGRA